MAAEASRCEHSLPTPFPGVNALLRRLLTDVQAALGGQFVGLYLYGSLSLGDFDPASSDVDFLVATEGVLPGDALARLRALHTTLAGSGLPYADRLEGSYIPRAALRRYNPDDARHPTIGADWPFQIGFHDSNWVLEYWIVRERGVVVAGPPPATLIEPNTPEELRAAVCWQLERVWRARAEDAAFLRPRHYAAFAVLTLCRALSTLRTGVVASKPRAAALTATAYPAWRPSIVRALAKRADHSDADLTETAETMAFLRDALAEARKWCEG
jgi:predicted nucleotidyltransferase